MSKKSDKTSTMPAIKHTTARIVREGILIGLMAICAYLALALMTYSTNDPGWSSTGTGDDIQNAGGPAGAWLADVFFSLFGNLAFLFPCLLVYQIVVQLRDREGLNLDPLVLLLRFVGLCMVMVSTTGIAVLQYGLDNSDLPFSSGGWLGLEVATSIEAAFGYIGGVLLLLAIFLFGLTIFIDISWFAVMDYIGLMVLKGIEYLKHRMILFKANREEKRQAKEAVKERREAAKVQTKIQEKRIPPTISPPKKKPAPSPRVQKEQQQSLFDDMPV